MVIFRLTLFLLGPVDAGKTCFINHTSMVVCKAGNYHPLMIQSCDQFGNTRVTTNTELKHFKMKLKTVSIYFINEIILSEISTLDLNEIQYYYMVNNSGVTVYCQYTGIIFLRKTI